ncbi:MAG TPA: thiopeptide-type bacteriocin biosynthesis protein, partial [Pyrinomonadaceae bacterium]
AIEAFIAAGKVWRVQIDTYEREVERYGGAEGIVLAEQIFHADSEAALKIIERWSGNEGLEARRLLTLRSIDQMLDDFGLELRDRSRLLEILLDKFAGDRVSKSRFATTYRNMRQAIERILEGTRDTQAMFDREFAILDQRSQQIEPAIVKLKTYAETGQLSVSLTELISNLIHVHTNRILRPAQPSEEVLLYDLLARFYRSRIARGQLSDLQ